MGDYEFAVDFMDMTNDMHVWTRLADGPPGFTPTVGRYVVVGDEDADSKVARIVSIDGNAIELEVLPGSVESHRDLLTSA